jgi:hypothetical protein
MCSSVAVSFSFETQLKKHNFVPAQSSKINSRFSLTIGTRGRVLFAAIPQFELFLFAVKRKGERYDEEEEDGEGDGYGESENRRYS